MFSASAELYDAIYGTFKDYAAESEKLASLIRATHPNARSILDVACGTGEHARILTERFGFEVDGVDLDAGLLEVARRKIPGSTFAEADMAEFHLERRYDVVMCLFSSIGYLKTLPRVVSALKRFREHLAPDGVILVEPWFPPGFLQDGYSATNAAEFAGGRVERTSKTKITERLSILMFDYRIERGSEISRASEVHELGLFTPDEMLACFKQAGLISTFDPVGLTDRGLYTARAT